MDIVVLSVVALAGVDILASLAGQNHQNKNQQQQAKEGTNTSKPEGKAVRGDELEVWPFTPMPIMTDTEVIFFTKLKQAMPNYLIFGQVQLSRIIKPTTDKSFWFNRICRQSVDYVLVDMDAQTTLLAIELDDWTHQSESRIKADTKKDKALTSAGIPMLRFHAENMPSVAILKHDIEEVLNQHHRKKVK